MRSWLCLQRLSDVSGVPTQALAHRLGEIQDDQGAVRLDDAGKLEVMNRLFPVDYERERAIISVALFRHCTARRLWAPPKSALCRNDFAFPEHRNAWASILNNANSPDWTDVADRATLSMRNILGRGYDRMNDAHLLAEEASLNQYTWREDAIELRALRIKRAESIIVGDVLDFVRRSPSRVAGDATKIMGNHLARLADVAPPLTMEVLGASGRD